MARVGIGEEEQVAGRRLSKLLAGPMLAQPAFGQRQARNDPQPAILGGQLSQDFTRTIA